MTSQKIKKLILSVFNSKASYEQHKNENPDGLNFVPLKKMVIKEVFRGTITAWNNNDVPICTMPKNWLIGYVVYDCKNEDAEGKFTATVFNGVNYKTWHEIEEIGLKQRDNNIIIHHAGRGNDAIIRAVYCLVEEE